MITKLWRKLIMKVRGLVGPLTTTLLFHYKGKVEDL